MTKQEAVAMFGDQTKLARALGITPQAVSQWPEEISLAQADRVTGAAIRVIGKAAHGSSTESTQSGGVSLAA